MNAAHRGKGAIFSAAGRSDKKTKLPLSPICAWNPAACAKGETAGYEGEFASVRRPLCLDESGTWTYRLAKDGTENRQTGRLTRGFSAR